jgi:hypothetical protein
MQNLAALLVDHPLPKGMTSAHPIGTDGFRQLDTPVSEANPVLLELLPLAQRVTGTSAFIVLKVRVGGSLAFCALSRYVNDKGLTMVVWRELLRLAHHLLATRDIPLVFSQIGRGACLEAIVDSAQNNGGLYERRSFGGYALRLGHPDGRHSAPLMWAVSLPLNTTGASGHSELTQIARATSSVLGMRIYLRELGQGYLVAEPSKVHTDAQVVLDGTNCRRVSNTSKWMCTRYAMVRQAEENGAAVPTKCATELNDADIFTKPLTGAAFSRAQASIMGHGDAPDAGTPK